MSIVLTEIILYLGDLKMQKFIIFIVILFSASNAFSVTASAKGKVTGYYTGWAKDEVRVQIEGATYTESNCQVKDGYVTIESDNTGYKTHVSALLAAYMSGKPVTIIVEGCIDGRPRIYGVYID
jgi:hypothetical protein